MASSHRKCATRAPIARMISSTALIGVMNASVAAPSLSPRANCALPLQVADTVVVVTNMLEMLTPLREEVGSHALSM